MKQVRSKSLINDYVLTEALKARQVAITADHPLSNGYSIHLFTNSVHAHENVRIPHDELMSYKGESCSNAMFSTYNNLRLYTITIDSRDQSMLRNIELVTHETSHLVDAMFKRCAFDMNALDTELRAYYLDWMVGKLLHFFNPITFHNGSDFSKRGE